KAQANLRRGQANSLGGVHGSEHIVDELLEVSVTFFYKGAGFCEDGIAEFDDRIYFDGLRWSFRHGDRCRLLFCERGQRQWFRTRRFVGHSCRNSCASRRGSLLQIFAEKHRLTQGRPWLRRQRPRRERRTSRSARKRLGQVLW